MFKKTGDKETEEAGAESAPKTSASKKEKINMLAEVAAANQKEQEEAVEEEVVF